MASGTSEQTLFVLAGGEPGIRNLVDAFYARVLANPKLQTFLAAMPMDRLRNMQYEFFAAALDGPPAARPQQLSYVHFGRGITKEHFGLFINCLFDTVKDLKLDESAARQIISHLNIYADEITGNSNGSE